jgi:hypothetical protein
VSGRAELARIEFPPEWLLGRSWRFTEVLFTKELDDGLAALAGGVLDDGTNLHALVFPGGQRLARHAPPDWSLETRLSGTQRTEMDEMWGATLEALANGMAEAKRLEGAS